MGAGCFYTLPQNRDIKAYWLNIGFPEDDDHEFYLFNDEKQNLIDTLKGNKDFCLGLDGVLYLGEIYRIVLEPTYNGDGILINLELLPRYENDQFYLRMLESSYLKLIRFINRFYPLCIATSGYTYSEIQVGQVAK